jgi:hypothetical protein
MSAIMPKEQTTVNEPALYEATWRNRGQMLRLYPLVKQATSTGRNLDQNVVRVLALDHVLMGSKTGSLRLTKA